MRFVKRYKQSRILIFTRFKILQQVNLSTGVEIDYSLLIAFTKYNTLALVEIHIGTIQLHQFADTHPC